MIGVKRKYDEDDKMKARAYYLENREEILEKQRKYREDNKGERKWKTYRVNTNTKKYKDNMEKLERLNKKIERLKNG